MALIQDYRPRKRCRLRLINYLTILLLLAMFAFETADSTENVQNVPLDRTNETNNQFTTDFNSKLLVNEEDEPECIQSAIHDFPEDFFTQEQRQMGGITVHFIITMYLCAVLGLICDKYFVPSLELISEILHVPTDVAGATFMAIGTSAPELFSSVIGSFVTEGDIGVGAIVGSAVFNVIGITGLAGLAVWKMDVHIDWYPITRDSFFYTLSIIALIVILFDNTVVWYEAIALLIMFVLYIVVMIFNSKLEIFWQQKLESLKSKLRNRAMNAENGEKKPLLKSKTTFDVENNNNDIQKNKKNVTFGDQVENSQEYVYRYENYGSSTETSTESIENGLLDSDVSIKVEDSIWIKPKGVLRISFWLIMWPAAFLMYYTVPDCRKEKWRPYYLLTFSMAVAWIAGMTYISVWMVTIIGYTFGIPDSISGITILAVGTSVPEIISSILVVRNGLGNMAICNLIGSNVFNIVFCLGAPWLIKTTLMSENGTIQINSAALSYMTITLLSTMVLLYIAFVVGKWKINRNLGFVCMIMYVAFIFLACYYELELTAGFSIPTCI